MSELATALSKAQAEMTAAAFDAINPHFKNRYATLSAVISAVREPLTKHGIAFIQRTSQVENGVGVETVFLGHGSEISTGVVVVPVDKRTAQGMGSALTYARRYSLAMACCIAADEDDDGNMAEKSAPKKGTRVVDAVLDGVKVDPGKISEYSAGIKAALFNEDAMGLLQLVDEIKSDHELTIAVWAELNSVERRQIKEMQKGAA